MNKNEVAEEAHKIMKTKILANDAKPLYKMQEVAIYMLKIKSYHYSKVKKKLEDISEDFFKGMSQEYIDSTISGVVDLVRNKEIKFKDISAESVPIYKEELEKIRALNNLNAEKLAFIFLVYGKRDKSYGKRDKSCEKRDKSCWKKACNPEMIRKAQISISNDTRIKLLHQLSGANMVRFSVFRNKKYFFDSSQDIANLCYCVPFKRDSGEIAFKVENFSADTLILYYLRYIGDKTVASCDECGCPIVKAGSKKKYCTHCAKEVKNIKNKQYKEAV